MEPLPRARRLYLARFFVLGGCILGLVCASTLLRPAAVEPTLLLGEGGPQGLTHGVVRGSHGYEVVLLEDADDDALLASGGYSAGASHASGFGVLKVEAAAGGADGFYAELLRRLLSDQGDVARDPADDERWVFSGAGSRDGADA